MPAIEFANLADLYKADVEILGLGRLENPEDFALRPEMREIFREDRVRDAPLTEDMRPVIKVEIA
jgi:hypothetical protein